MDTVKIYLVIRDEETKEEVSIKGNIELLTTVIKKIGGNLEAITSEQTRQAMRGLFATSQPDSTRQPT